jgi:LCP family protein required for cell wall assembly
MNKKNKKSPIIPIIAVVLVAVLMFSGFQLLMAVFSPANTEENKITTTKTITRNGKEYYPRQDITVFMLLGIDQQGPVEASDSYNNDGEADMVALAIFDESDKTFNVLVLNRDTMMNVPILGIGGKPAGTSFEQLALSHTYGTGLEDSCENTRTAVSDFLYGLNIDYYISMNMDAIAILNDAVGGVTVNVTDDFSAVDPSITKGEVTLKGDQALTFIQTRKDVGNQMNISRMDRHKEYMNGFIKAFNNQLKNNGDSFVYETYTAIDKYMVTDTSVNTMSNLINKYSEYSLKDIITPEGENVTGADYMEFYADENKLDQMILNLFYAEK